MRNNNSNNKNSASSAIDPSQSSALAESLTGALAHEYFENPTQVLAEKLSAIFTRDYESLCVPPKEYFAGINITEHRGLYFGRVASNSPSKSKDILINTASAKNPSFSLQQIACIPKNSEFGFHVGLNMPATISPDTSLPVEIFVQTRDSSKIGAIGTWIVFFFKVIEPQTPAEFLIIRSLSVLNTQSSEKAIDFQKLDVFAKTFIPDWMKGINKMPAAILPGIPPPHPNFFQYIHSHVHHSLSMFSTTFVNLPEIPELFAIPPLPVSLRPDTYAQHFLVLMGIEVLYRRNEARGFEMFGIRIFGNAGMWQVIVPGIIEDAPKLCVGDRLFIRPIQRDNEFKEHGFFAGIEYEAFVFNVKRSSSTVFFHLPHLPNTQAMVFNIRFEYTDLAHRHSARALMDLDPKFLRAEYGRKVLFPEPEDCTLRLGNEAKTSTAISLDFVDSALNWPQKKAIQSIVDNKYGSSIPYLIWGPPGTGKTKTCIESILQILKSNRSARILACAPSHSSADTLTQRLQRHLPPTELLRFNAATRPFAEVPDNIMAYTFTHLVHDDSGVGCFAIPPASALASMRVVVCTCADAGVFTQIGLSNSQMSASYDAWYSEMRGKYALLCEGVNVSKRRRPFWTHLFIDEAGQASESESVITLGVVASEPVFEQNGEFGVQIILSGDHMQLGPIIHSEIARNHGLNISWFERLIRRPVYRDHPESRFSQRAVPNNIETNKSTKSTHTQDSILLPDCVAPFINLVRNYRSHPSFLMTPSHAYYNDTLISAAPDFLVNSFLGSSFLPNSEIPILFCGIRGTDERATGTIESIANARNGASAGWFNAAEAFKIVEMIELLLKEHQVDVKEFGVISPFREQVKVIRHLLRKHKLSYVDVGTVEDYQGMERRIILISTVRSRSQFLAQDIRNDLGLVHFPARLNVAMTRAQALLVIVGDPWLLVNDPHWKSFLLFYVRNKCYTGCELPESIFQESSNGENIFVHDNYGTMEHARDIARRMAEAPVSKWLGKSGGDEDALMRNDEWIEGLILE